MTTLGTGYQAEAAWRRFRGRRRRSRTLSITVTTFTIHMKRSIQSRAVRRCLVLASSQESGCSSFCIAREEDAAEDPEETVAKGDENKGFESGATTMSFDPTGEDRAPFAVRRLAFSYRRVLRFKCGLVGFEELTDTFSFWIDALHDNGS